MKAFLTFAAVVGALVLASAADDPTVSLPGVVDLTPANFDTVVNGRKAALIEFYAPWCGHCKRLVPEYTKLGELVQNDPKLRNRVVIAKVDADAHRSLGEKFGVQGFPTIKYLPAGKPANKDNAIDYNQARTATAFVDYIKEKLASAKGFAQVDALNALAKKFGALTDKEGQQALIKEATEAVAKLAGEAKENGELYVKLMQKAVEKGADYLSKEKARLDKMLSGGSLSAAKADEFGRKADVLGAFAASEEDEE